MSEPSAEPVGTPRDKAELTGQNAIFDVLADSVRCHAVGYLAEATGAVPLDDLVSFVIATLAAGEVTPRRRKRTEIRFHHVHLPKMEAAGLLDYDRDERLVEPTEAVDVARDLREQVADSRRR